MSIYTRTGDTGTTALFGGKRVLKCEELVDVYGSIDELNSWVGLISSDFDVPDVQQFLEAIQSDLFTIGSTLAGWRGDLVLLDSRIKEMEARIDLLEKELPPIKNFILPGGTVLGARTHIVRAICRRVERQTVALISRQPSARLQAPGAPATGGQAVSFQQKDKNIILKYLNRLSDLFFMLARFINKEENVEEVVWSGIRSKPS